MITFLEARGLTARLHNSLDDAEWAGLSLLHIAQRHPYVPREIVPRRFAEAHRTRYHDQPSSDVRRVGGATARLVGPNGHEAPAQGLHPSLTIGSYQFKGGSSINSTKLTRGLINESLNHGCAARAVRHNGYWQATGS
jgi:hypothetical protein